MTTEAVNNNLNILIHPTFTNVNRLFVLAYQNADDRQSFSQFYLPRVLVKDFNVIIDKLAFFDLPVKTEEEAYEKIIVKTNLNNSIFEEVNNFNQTSKPEIDENILLYFDL